MKEGGKGPNDHGFKTVQFCLQKSIAITTNSWEVL